MQRICKSGTDSLMKSGKSTDSLVFSGKFYRFFAEIRLALDLHSTHPARPSREKTGALQSPLAMKAPPHTTIKAQLKRLLSSGIVGGGDVHVAFVASDVCKRLAVQET